MGQTPAFVAGSKLEELTFILNLFHITWHYFRKCLTLIDLRRVSIYNQ